MWQTVKDHPYLFSQLLSLALLVPILRAARPVAWRRTGLLAALLGAPLSLGAPLHEGWYWTPERICGRVWGIEDLLFASIAAMLAWLCASTPWRRRMPAQYGARSAARRFVMITLLGLAPLVIARHWLQPGMLNLCLLSAPLVAVLVWRAWRAWRLAFAGALLFPPVYLALVALHLHLWPGYTDYWNPDGMWSGVTLMRIPIGEYLWAYTYGAGWPLLVAYVLDIRVSARPAER